MTKLGNPVDRRNFGRRKTNLHGWIEVQGRPRLRCLVKDISIGGALLALDTPQWLPYNFRLLIEATRFASWCEVRHQAPGAMGVRFLSAVDAASIDSRSAAESRSLNDQSAWQGDHR